MKKARIDFTLSVDVDVRDRLDLDRVADAFLSSYRFGIGRVQGDPQGVSILSASSALQGVINLTKEE